MPSRPFDALRSSIGTKLVIAISGLCLFIFLVTHLTGNLLFLLGPETFNEYSHRLTSNPLVYVAEAGLLAVFALHVIQAAVMWVSNQAARPARYRSRAWGRSKNPRSHKTLASSSMILTGTITLLFVMTHLATFKFGPHYSSETGIRDVYRLQLEVFSSPVYVIFYLTCMGVIFMHLWHGLGSASQSLGLDQPIWTRRVLAAGKVLALVIAGGFFVLPIYTYFVARVS